MTTELLQLLDAFTYWSVKKLRSNGRFLYECNIRHRRLVTASGWTWSDAVRSAIHKATSRPTATRRRRPKAKSRPRKLTAALLLCLCPLWAMWGGGCTTIKTPYGTYTSTKNIRFIVEGVEVPELGKVAKIEIVGDASPVLDSTVEAFKAGLAAGAAGMKFIP